MNFTVFVIDDDEAARESLTFMLRAEGMVSRAFGSPRAFLDQLHKDQSGCIVTDVRMPEMDGMTLVLLLREMGCAMPVVVITGHADVPMAVQAMKAGVADFIEKPFESDHLLRAVRTALEMSDARLQVQSRRAVLEQRRRLLTERESQVMEKVVQGSTNKEIAQELGISYRTVEIYRANVMSKMQAESLSDLVKMMLETQAA